MNHISKSHGYISKTKFIEDYGPIEKIETTISSEIARWAYESRNFAPTILTNTYKKYYMHSNNYSYMGAF